MTRTGTGPRLEEALAATEAYVARKGCRGYDPYDALTSPLFRLPVLRSAWLPRWGAQQVLKRLPVQIRPALGIRKGYNPVTLALVAQALTDRDRAAGGRHRAATVAHLVGELARLRSRGYSGSCWGYDFDWEARYARIPAGHPTIVATGFVTHALYEVHRHYQLVQARDLVLDAVPFLLHDLHRTWHGETFCWSYSPTDRQEVLNATMKGARLLAQAVALGGDPAWLAEARATVAHVAACQRPDGSWPYSVSDARAWADNFHTGYNLDCLDEYARLAGDEGFRETLAAGVAHYVASFFTAEGIPKYYDRSLHPIDATCCGQALLSLVRCGRVDLAQRTAHWVLDHMALGNGAFKYQIHRRYENRIVYMRWSVAWLFAGLSRLARAIRAEEES